MTSETVVHKSQRLVVLVRLLIAAVLITIVVEKKARMYGYTYSKSMDQPGKAANPASGQLNRENEYFPVCVLCA